MTSYLPFIVCRFHNVQTYRSIIFYFKINNHNRKGPSRTIHITNSTENNKTARTLPTNHRDFWEPREIQYAKPSKFPDRNSEIFQRPIAFRAHKMAKASTASVRSRRKPSSCATAEIANQPRLAAVSAPPHHKEEVCGKSNVRLRRPPPRVMWLMSAEDGLSSPERDSLLPVWWWTWTSSCGAMVISKNRWVSAEACRVCLCAKSSGGVL